MCVKCEVLRDLQLQNEAARVQLELDKSRANVNNTQAVGTLVESIRQLEELGHLDRAKAVGKLLDSMLPKPEPKAEQATGETNSIHGHPTAEGATNAPDEVSAFAKDLAQMLGVQVQVVRFPKE